jgi:alpha-L-fucosidase
MKLKPTKGQLAFLDWEYGMFFHFGPATFSVGYQDVDEVELKDFNPTELDCDDWISTAKAAGAKYAILTTKHHNGFALWPSKYTEYGVKNTPWKDGKGDVVAEFVSSCRKYGLKVGLYYSPAQWGKGAASFKDAKEYDDYFINQISELLSNYGKIDYLWFDGYGSEGREYDKKRIVEEIFRLQPDILTFCDPAWTPCVRWIGNEDGYASLDNPLVVDKWNFSVLTEEAVSLGNSMFLPAECDCKLRSTWFWYDYNEDTIKDVEELFGMYEQSVGHGSNFLINIGPDNRGLIADADKARILELGERIKKNYSNPLKFSGVIQDGNTFTIANKDCDIFFATKNTTFEIVNTVVIEEDLTEGQSIKSFNLYAHLPYDRLSRILVYIGKTVGHKLICRFPAIRSPKITMEVTESDGTVVVKDMKAYFVK